ncbi:hypothetical protein TWF694_011389 [Orbilia ellipsospora]|uniref:Rhamnogalacturonase A/B/Epimerase-like pectate lyase domain-containing protein n=1 Tax=Orbilia ellipsospora TaxID=2528407 RepID=A0AAV9X687_9PEZI
MRPSHFLQHFSWLVVLCFCFVAVESRYHPKNNSTRTRAGRAPAYKFTQAQLDAVGTKVAAFRERDSKRFQATKHGNLTARAHTLATRSKVRHSAADINNARKLIAKAQKEQAAYNAYIMANPRKNLYAVRNSFKRSTADPKAVPFPVHSTDTIKAARLLASVDAQAKTDNGTWVTQTRNKAEAFFATHNVTEDTHQNHARDTFKGADSYWLAQMDHSTSTSPFSKDAANYKVWRNVLDYGAVGDGVADDTDAINNAISDGGRCGSTCLSSTTKPAVVYFPPGNYLVSSPLISLYNTQMIGSLARGSPDYVGQSLIIAAPSFIGQGVITSDVYNADGVTEWYINQSNFYRQVRNLQIDLTQANLQGIMGIHWQVAQATSLSNIAFSMSDKKSSTQVGVYGENGSGGWMDNLYFFGGQYGFLGGNQQYTVTRSWFIDCANGVGMVWDWGWTWSRLIFQRCDVGINFQVPGQSAKSPVGSMYLMDSGFQDTPTAIKMPPFGSKEQGTTTVTLDNIAFLGVDQVFTFTDNSVSKIDAGQPLDYLTWGSIIQNGESTFGQSFTRPAPRPDSMTQPVPPNPAVTFTFAQKFWFSRDKPTYSQNDVSNFVNFGWFATGKGDDTDYTSVLQLLIDYCVLTNSILFIPAGVYVIKSTLYVRSSSRIVGEAWSQIMATGSVFNDPNNDIAAIVVGQSGNAGVVELTDLLFTSRGQAQGLVLVEWDMIQQFQGAVGMWDCHFRVGGAVGSNLQVPQCPKGSGTINPNCKAASTLLTITNAASAYLENVWGWVADHDIDDSANTQIDVYVKRGVDIRSLGPTWLWGTAFEHAIYYQYALIAAQNVFMSMIQTESPYYQGVTGTQSTKFPSTVSNAMLGDPDFADCGLGTTNCNVAWGLYIRTTKNAHIMGAALYSWFINYDEDCVNTSNCQQKMVSISESGPVVLNHLITIGSVQMIEPGLRDKYNFIRYATNYTQAVGYPWWSIIGSYLDFIEPIDPLTVQNHVNPVGGWTAFGDSYAAGIGTGKPYDTDQTKCRRGTGAYGYQMQKIITSYNAGLPNPGGPATFDLLACSGATMNDLLKLSDPLNQIVLWDPSRAQYDFVTLSISGNDVGFGNIAAHCIYGWPSNSNCDQDINDARRLIDEGTGGTIEVKLRAIFAAIFAKRTRQDTRMKIWVNGYPKFFATDDGTCNGDFFKVHWPGGGKYLTLDFRNTLNNLSRDLNILLQSIIDRWNNPLEESSVLFKDFNDDATIYQTRRFCEPGVHEPRSKETQYMNAFFYLDGPDSGEDPPPPPESVSADYPTEVIRSNTCIPPSRITQLDQALCSVAQYLQVEVAAGNFTIQGNQPVDDDLTVMLNSDGSVTIYGPTVNQAKAFHPKTSTNLNIAIQLWEAIKTVREF